MCLLLKEVGLLLTKGWFPLEFKSSNEAPTTVDSKGTPIVVWGGVFVGSCLGYEEFLKKKGKVRYLTKIFLSIDRNECSI